MLFFSKRNKNGSSAASSQPAVKVPTPPHHPQGESAARRALTFPISSICRGTSDLRSACVRTRLCDGFYLHLKFLCVTRGNGSPRCHLSPSAHTHGPRFTHSHTLTQHGGESVCVRGKHALFTVKNSVSVQIQKRPRGTAFLTLSD